MNNRSSLTRSIICWCKAIFRAADNWARLLICSAWTKYRFPINASENDKKLKKGIRGNLCKQWQYCYYCELQLLMQLDICLCLLFTVFVKPASNPPIARALDTFQQQQIILMALSCLQISYSVALFMSKCLSMSFLFVIITGAKVKYNQCYSLVQIFRNGMYRQSSQYQSFTVQPRYFSFIPPMIACRIRCHVCKSGDSLCVMGRSNMLSSTPRLN